MKLIHCSCFIQYLFYVILVGNSSNKLVYVVNCLLETIPYLSISVDYALFILLCFNKIHDLFQRFYCKKDCEIIEG